MPTIADSYADGTLDVKEAARFTSLGRTTLYDLMASGKLPYTQLGAKRLIPRRALVRLLTEGNIGGRELAAAGC